MTAPTFDLSGRVALITGASGGLGRHFAHVLAGAGASVAVAARRAGECEAVAAAINGAGGKAVAVSMDVTRGDSIVRAFDAAGDALGPVTIVVNNAGVAETASLMDMNQAGWDRVLDTNLKGAWLVGREGARRMADAQSGDKASDKNGDKNGGVIINIASILGERVAGGLGAYGASKAGLVQLTKSMALEWARYGIRVNALAPGYIETDLNRDFLTSGKGQDMKGRIPQRRFGHMSDLDGPLLLLASDGAGYMTGAVLTVDGGHAISAL